MKIDLNFELLNLQGDPFKGNMMASRLLAEQLANATTGDPLKLYYWAEKLYNGKVLELDPSDIETLVSFIKSNTNLTNLSKAQMLLKIKE